MVNRLSSVEDVLKGSPLFADCHISTDIGEARSFLESIGFFKKPDSFKPDLPYLANCPEYQPANGWDDPSYMMASAYGTITELLLTMPLEESLQRGLELGFNPMTKIRIFPETSNPKGEIEPIIRQLGKNHQNFALESSEGTYISLSSHYSRASGPGDTANP